MKADATNGRLALVAASVTLLAACGGGGSQPAAVEQAQRVAITQDNATSVAAQAVDAGSGGVPNNAVVTGVQVSAEPAVPASAIAALGGAVRRSLEVRAPAVLAGVTASTTVNCASGGSIDVAVDVTDPDTATPGDRADFTFNACVEAGVTSTGRLTAILVSVNVPGTLIVSDVIASGFTATRTGVGERLDGTVRVTLDDSNIIQSAIGVTSGSFSFERLVAGSVRATRTLTDYAYRIETVNATGDTRETFSFTASGTFPKLGRVSLVAATTQPVITPNGALRPTSGAGVVTGANGSNVAITVTSTGLRLDVDSNGDGSVDATLTPTWVQIDTEL